jgi:periplasmic mercuric ion binding protein
MKTLSISLCSLLLICFSFVASAQVKKEEIKVAGECGMCKKKIEKAAKEAGASTAEWNTESKVLLVKYDSKNASNAKIQQAVAAVGYDTPDYKASEEAYNKLHECCKYERVASSSKEAHACCQDKKCEAASCMKDGKCTKDMSCCKDSGCDKKDCCEKH